MNEAANKALVDGSPDHGPKERSRILSAYSLIVDLFWGDVTSTAAVFRTLIKIFVAVALAYLIHQFLASKATLFDTRALSQLGQLFDEADKLINIRVGPQARFPDIKLDKSVGEAHVCLDLGDMTIPGDGLVGICKNPSKRRQIGYQIISSVGGIDKRVDKDVFFELSKDEPLFITSRIAISSSVDVFLRRIERVAFNPLIASVADIRLCSGTRDLLANECNLTSCIGELLEGKGECRHAGFNFGELLQRMRILSLFFGDIRFLTLVIFVYCCIEILGLYGCWVWIPNRLFREKSLGGQTSMEIFVPPRVKELDRMQLRSVGDKLVLQALNAGLDPVHNKPAEDSIVDSIHSYREHLFDDALLRREHLETLGDTLLKIAFLGTVWGISAALFTARGLDSADPIEKLIVKAEMYSGIGVGFGTTLLGITLSVLVSQLSTTLAGSWNLRIATVYELLRALGPERIALVANDLSEEDKVELQRIPGKSSIPIPVPDSAWTNEQIIGLVVVVSLAGLGFAFRNKILDVLSYFF